MNKAASEKDFQTYEDRMSYKLCYHAHLFGKNILALLRQLFTFSGSLIISINSYALPLQAKYFEDFETFQKIVASNLSLDKVIIPVDFAAIPKGIVSNMVILPKMFRVE